MAVLEREGLHGAAPTRRREEQRPWEEWPAVAPGGPPDVPPAFYWDDDGRDDGDGEPHPWARRVLAAVGIVVLLCMVFSPVAADLLGGHTTPAGGVTTSSGDR